MRRVPKLLAVVICWGGAVAAWASPPREVVDGAVPITVTVPSLTVDNAVINGAFRIAIGDLLGNVTLFQRGLLERPAPVILAGLDYKVPWTRDAAVNVWNGSSLLMPQVARNTLVSVLQRSDGGVRIGEQYGQYWDSIVWTTGAWNHYVYTGDKEFLALAFEATKNSLAFFEETEFDAEDNLFRGPGWSDGIAAYPDEYAETGGSSGILDWLEYNPDKAVKPGVGIPIKALSTNCLYYNAYVLVEQMARQLSAPVDPQWSVKAERIKRAINTRLWNESQGCYRFLIGPLGDCDHQEALGSSYALLFGIAGPKQAEAIFANQYVAPAGIPCGWPNLPRYERPDGMSFGRHMATVWPQIQGFWAEAAARAAKADIFGHELFNLAAHAVRDKHFAEVYHPITGEVYGGLQEAQGRGIVLWDATSRQTWAATAYLRMVLLGLVGMRFDTEGVRFQPCVPKGISSVTLRNIRYREMDLSVTLQGTGTHVKQCLVNGQASKDGFLPARDKGHHEVTILLDGP